MRKILIFILLAILFTNCNAQSNDENSKTNQKSLEEIMTKIDLKKIKEFDSLYNYNPINDSTDYRGVAVLYISKKQFSLAIEKIKEELNVNPKNADALHLVGYALNEGGNPSESIDYFNKAIQLDSTNDVFFYNRGLAFYRLNKFEQSISDYSKTIILNPKNKDVYLNRALAFEGIRMFDNAVLDYSSDINFFGESAKIYNNRGRCYMIQNKYKLALMDYDKALSIEPNKANTLFNKGILYFKQNQLDKGCEFIKKAKTLGYNDNGMISKYCN